MTTYEVIQHQEVGAGGAASITFSNIPQTYTDLQVVLSLRAVRTGDPVVFQHLKINGSTASITNRSLWFYSTTVYSNSNQNEAIGEITTSGATSNTFANTSIYFPNYALTTQYKSFSVDSMGENNGTSGGGIRAGLWSSNSAITSLEFLRNDADLAQYSSATLIGIKRAALPTPTDVYSDSLLEEKILTSSTASVVFSNLDTYAALGYTNLQVRYVVRSSVSSLVDDLWIFLNGDTNSNYSNHYMRGNGTNVISAANPSYGKIYDGGYTNTGNTAPANAFGVGVVDILDPFETTKYTTVRIFGAAPYTSSGGYVALNSGLWMNTAALTTISFDLSSGDYLAGSRFSLYGSK